VIQKAGTSSSCRDTRGVFHHAEALPAEVTALLPALHNVSLLVHDVTSLREKWSRNDGCERRGDPVSPSAARRRMLSSDWSADVLTTSTHLLGTILLVEELKGNSAAVTNPGFFLPSSPRLKLLYFIDSCALSKRPQGKSNRKVWALVEVETRLISFTHLLIYTPGFGSSPWVL